MREANERATNINWIKLNKAPFSGTSVARRCLACRAQRGPLGVLPKAKRPRGAFETYETFWSQRETTPLVAAREGQRVMSKNFRRASYLYYLVTGMFTVDLTGDACPQFSFLELHSDRG